MTDNDLQDEQVALEETVAKLRKLSQKWWGNTPADLKRRWAFECFSGCICIRKDAKRALAEARKQGYREPHLYLYDVSSDKVYLPDRKEYDPNTDDLHTEPLGAGEEDLRLVN
jgi:hypothetical protein